ncbi:hypothetical protein EBZ39_02725 [bacterium]|nr:hypothetical protein [bacterium]
MINHARTLLINAPATQQFQTPGYEYVPADFVPIPGSDAVQRIRRILFGRNPDAYFLNSRAKELLSYIHGTELESYVTALDSRITYWPEIPTSDLQFFNAAPAKIAVTQQQGAPRTLNISGKFAADSALGIASANYIIDFTADSATVRVCAKKLDANIGNSIDCQTLLPGQPINLAGTNLNVAVNATALATNYAQSINTADLNVSQTYAAPNSELQQTTHAQWILEALANPSPAITTLLPTLELLGETTFLTLFGVNPAEPFRTFKNLWFEHPIAAYRLAGLTLALIYRVNEERVATNG